MKHYLPLFIFFIFITSPSQAQSNASRAGSSARLTASNTYIQIYPNPATSYFGITEVKGIEKIFVFNLVGRKLKQFQDIAADKKYSIGDLPKGMYLVQMIDKNNKVITTRRISKR